MSGGSSSGGKHSTFAVSLTNFLDSGCIVAGASGLTLWQNEFGLSSFMIGLLGAVSANAFGSAVGALIGGYLADKFGRKFILEYNMLVYMVGALFVVFAMNLPMLLAGFVILGLSVGAGVPASWTYISETADTGNRARNIGSSQFAWSLGPAIIFTLGTVMAPLGLLGNRLLFALLFVVSFIAWLLQRKIEESAAFEEEKARRVESNVQEESMFKTLFSKAVNVKAILFLVGVYCLWNLVAGAMGFFMPFVYESVGGLSGAQSNLLNAAQWILIAAGTYFIFAKLGDRMSQRLLFFIGAALAALAWVVLTYVSMSLTFMWVFVILWGVSAGIGAQAFYALWATELFAARYRGGAQGVMFFAVRGAAGVWSMIFPVILSSLGFKVAGTCMIIFLLLSLLIGTIWTPKTQGKSLKEIEKERYGALE